MGNDHSRGIASRGAATGVRFCRIWRVGTRDVAAPQPWWKINISLASDLQQSLTVRWSKAGLAGPVGENARGAAVIPSPLWGVYDATDEGHLSAMRAAS
jgi:hypothetical protein